MKLSGYDLMIVTFIVLWCLFFRAFWWRTASIRLSSDVLPGTYQLSDGFTIVSSR